MGLFFIVLLIASGANEIALNAAGPSPKIAGADASCNLAPAPHHNRLLTEGQVMAIRQSIGTRSLFPSAKVNNSARVSKVCAHCGKEFQVTRHRAKRAKFCCIECSYPSRAKHGMYDSPEHLAWRHMKDRCCNPKSQRYDRYGGRGIAVCERWMRSFRNFYADLGPRPSPDHSIGRKNNEGDYEPGNVRWEVDAEQNANKCTSRFIYLRGERLTINEAARRLRVCGRTLALRLDAGWSDERATGTPIAKRRWLKADEVSIIKGLLTIGKTRSFVAAVFGVCLSAIDRIVNGRSWKHVTAATSNQVETFLAGTEV